MKIKKLVLQNINSLYGKWEIDFDCDKFRQSGIFAITGKTGSGKSSILDAMCLALYGKTPRLNKDTSEAVSRGCSECMCELTFLDTEGREWIATFAYEMIKKGGNKGKMKSDALHRLSCNGKTEADKTTRVQKMVEEITGLDSERFCRAVMLAQGSFDAFLNAGKDNGEILERITGTEIYSKIAEKLKERYHSETGKLAAIKVMLEGISPLSEEETEQLKLEIATLDKEITALAAEQKSLNQLFQKFQQLELHTRNLDKCSSEEKSLDEDTANFMPLKKRFEDGKKVLEADEKYRPLKELMDQQNISGAELLKNEQLFAEQEKLFSEHSKQLDEVSAEARNYEKEFEQLSQLLTSVNHLDTIIKTLNTSVDSALNKRKNELIKSLDCRKKLSESCSKLNDLIKDHTESAAYLDSHAGDGELAPLKKICSEWLENVRSAIRELTGTGEQISVLQKKLDDLQKDGGEKEKLLKKEEEKFNKLTNDEAKARKQLDETLEGATREHWQNLYGIQDKCYHQAQLLMTFEEHRKQLRDGEECPLCGAKEHPYAAGNTPQPEKELEELKKLKKRLDLIEKAEKNLQEVSAELTGCANVKMQYKNAIDQLKLQIEAQNREIAALRKTEEKLQNDRVQIEKKIDDSLLRFGLNWDKENCLLLPELDQRIKRFDECKVSKEIFEEKKNSIQNNISSLSTLLKTLLSNCRTLRQEWKSEKEKLAGETANRRELFGSRNPEEEKQEAEKKRKAISARLEKAQRAFTEITTNRKRTAEDILKLQTAIKLLSEKIISARESFIFACQTAGVTEDEFHACVLNKEELTTLSARDASLKARRKQLEETRKNCEQEINILTRFLEGKPGKEEVVTTLNTISEQLQNKNQDVGGLRQKLNDDVQAKQKKAEQLAKFAEQQKVEALWRSLYDLIGTKDKFQRFAQGITLEHLLVLANSELEKLSGRYRLLRSQDEELEIDVADKDQGDVIRSCKTLSGGERFLVSLALALGLSQMAGEKIRVDSLFLDEGFGTLDAETLDVALEALSNLRNRGKLVGVISHVTAFSERIPCIIEVNKSGGGRSTLSGPGIKAI